MVLHAAQNLAQNRSIVTPFGHVWWFGMHIPLVVKFPQKNRSVVFVSVYEDSNLGSSRMRAWCIVELQNASVAHSESAIPDDVHEK